MTYYQCDICECFHPYLWNGDCRENANRFIAEELDIKHGPDDWKEEERP